MLEETEFRCCSLSLVIVTKKRRNKIGKCFFFWRERKSDWSDLIRCSFVYLRFRALHLLATDPNVPNDAHLTYHFFFLFFLFFISIIIYSLTQYESSFSLFITLRASSTFGSLKFFILVCLNRFFRFPPTDVEWKKY